MSEGAWDMLLHLCRIRPLPKPYPPDHEGRRYLAELLYAGLIAPSKTSAAGFAPTASGLAIVRAKLAEAE